MTLPLYFLRETYFLSSLTLCTYNLESCVSRIQRNLRQQYMNKISDIFYGVIFFLYIEWKMYLSSSTLFVWEDMKK